MGATGIVAAVAKAHDFVIAADDLQLLRPNAGKGFEG